VKHVYLAPHLDDAVLSCGATIHRQTAAGEQVLVITFFAGEPPAGVPLSSFALVQHGYWGNPPRPMALRCAEDLAALTLLGAEAQHLDYLDAVYRAGPDGQWLYMEEDALFGTVHAQDPLAPERGMLLADHLVELIPADTHTAVYAPLGAGRHVDHQVVHVAARLLGDKGYQVGCYEDYPYSEWPGAVDAALAVAGAGHWSLETRPVDPSDLAAKVSAVAYYRSQMSILFGGAEAMPSRVWAFAAARPSPGCLAERIWWPG
jgi:LmbE family N-acetylglucosaminyl deacetylase